jgi:hydroxymethylbilane synthase
MKKKIVIGTRGSKLALVQTDIIKKQLLSIHPHLTIEIKTITTTGDKNMSPVPLDNVGKNWFTKEIDKALLNGVIDIAVHSLKDLPETLPTGLTIAAIPKREDAREAFVSKNNILFSKLKKSAIIGTDSTRRKAQILDKRSDLIVKSIRGNVNTRLEKLENGEYDGIFLAVAGLKRLGIENKITEYFSETDIVPSPGQGALAVVVREKDKALINLLEKLNDKETVTAVKTERAFSKIFGGGCSLPIGAYATCYNKVITIHGFVGSLDGKERVKGYMKGNNTTPEELGRELANKFLAANNVHFKKSQFIVITKPENVPVTVQKQIESLGFLPYFYPSITIVKSELTKKMSNTLSQIDSFDWIVFTSQNGVQFFIEALEESGISLEKIKNKKIAVVGKKTASVVKKYKLPVDFIPSSFTTDALADEMKDIKNKKILLARANLATPLLPKHLEEKGAKITDLHIYKTSYIENDNPEFEELLKTNQIYCLTFTSPSTVKGFLNNIKNSPNKKNIFSLRALSIGPATTKELEKNGFQNIITADPYTLNGMIATLKENILS